MATDGWLGQTVRGLPLVAFGRIKIRALHGGLMLNEPLRHAGEGV